MRNKASSISLSDTTYRSIWIWAFLLLTVLITQVGCEGAAGPDGDNAFLSDTLAPVVEWIEPLAGAEVDSLVTLSIIATDDQAVNRVMFYVAGWEFKAELIDSMSGSYQSTWNSSNYPNGPYPLTAQVWDDARNHSTTPVIVVWR